QLFGWQINFSDFFPPSFFDPWPIVWPSFFPDFSNITARIEEWDRAFQKRFKELFKSTSASFKSNVETVNGTTIITQKIGGKTYKGEIPEGKSYFLSSSSLFDNGTTMEIVKIVADGKTSIYKTMDGKTSVTDENDKPLADGGFFGVKPSSEPIGEAKASDSGDNKKEPVSKPGKTPKKAPEDQ
ncbi:hypothetical protein TELCIR_26287, partial [Teladorsagia circumcincta]